MPKIIFNYGTMSSMKSASIIAKTVALRERGKEVVLMKPLADTRESEITSRATRTTYPAILIGETDKDFDYITEYLVKNATDGMFVFIDECQMLSTERMKSLLALIKELETSGVSKDMTVMFYGLKNNFKNELFDSIKVLLAEADSIEELKSTCDFCNNKATTHMLSIDGEYMTDGSELAVENSETEYFSVCQSCRWKRLERYEYGE